MEMDRLLEAGKNVCQKDDASGQHWCPCGNTYPANQNMIMFCNDLSLNKTGPQCSLFCDEFPCVIPFVYFGCSILSALCCCLVLTTYFCMPRLRQTGYSSKVFLNR